jgi:hypothetical protein
MPIRVGIQTYSHYLYCTPVAEKRSVDNLYSTFTNIPNVQVYLIPHEMYLCTPSTSTKLICVKIYICVYIYVYTYTSRWRNPMEITGILTSICLTGPGAPRCPVLVVLYVPRKQSSDKFSRFSACVSRFRGQRGGEHPNEPRNTTRCTRLVVLGSGIVRNNNAPRPNRP